MIVKTTMVSTTETLQPNLTLNIECRNSTMLFFGFEECKEAAEDEEAGLPVVDGDEVVCGPEPEDPHDDGLYD